MDNFCQCGCKTKIPLISKKHTTQRFVHGHGRRGKGSTPSSIKKGQTGVNHPQWNGGRYIDNKGYVWIWTPRGHIMEHRLVMEKHLGRPLSPQEEIHHIDRDRQNNDISNLKKTTKSEHSIIHSPDRNNWTKEMRDKQSKITSDYFSNKDNRKRQSQIMKKYYSTH